MKDYFNIEEYLKAEIIQSQNSYDASYDKYALILKECNETTVDNLKDYYYRIISKNSYGNEFIPRIKI